MSKFFQLGSINISNDSGREYLSLTKGKDDYNKEGLVNFHRALTAFLKDDGEKYLNLSLICPKARLKLLLEQEKITEEQYEERLDKVPSFIGKEIYFIVKDEE